MSDILLASDCPAILSSCSPSEPPSMVPIVELWLTFFPVRPVVSAGGIGTARLGGGETDSTPFLGPVPAQFCLNSLARDAALPQVESNATIKSVE